MTSPDATSENKLPAAAADAKEPGTAAAPDKAAPEKSKPAKPRKLKRKKRKILERTAENDIRYRGPLSYRHFRIIAWICIALSQVVLLMRLDQMIEPEYAAVYDTPIQVLGLISSLALPFLLIANFATILSGRERYGRQLLRYGGLSLVVTALYMLFYFRYALGTAALLTEDSALAPEAVERIARLLFPQGFFSFNIFIDLFLCSLFMFLLNCRPKKHFQGKKVVWLRLLALVPVLYELGCIVLKGYAAVGSGGFSLPVWTYPFLTTKPPVTFLVFIILAFYVKKRERVFLKNEKTHEDFTAHMKTNYNSLRFSLYTSKIFLIAGLLDVVLLFALPFVIGADPGHLEESYDPLFKAVQSSGFGDSIMLIPMIPFMLLFSYTRTHKNRLIDAVIPLGGIALIIAVYVEGSYQVLTMLSGYLSPTLREVLRGLLFSGMP